MIVNSKEIILKAFKNGYAIPAINTQGGTYDIIMAICQAAEKLQSPIILAHYKKTGKYSGDDWFVQVAKWCASKVNVPVAIHLDHGDSLETVVRCIKYGFTSIMYDGSELDIEENARNTNEIIRICHAVDIPVEAEVGALSPANLEENNTGAQNVVSVDEVKAFLSLCTPDTLALGIGNAHGFYKGKPCIRLDILEQCRSLSDIPIVLHGCTGIPDDVVKKAIKCGVAKINFGTLVRHKYIDFYEEGIKSIDHQGHSWMVSAYANEKLQEVIKDIIYLSGSEGKA
ncbi:MAG: class II fructose-bisphosphate aldolase [Bacillota bacterium]